MAAAVELALALVAVVVPLLAQGSLAMELSVLFPLVLLFPVTALAAAIALAFTLVAAVLSTLLVLVAQL